MPRLGPLFTQMEPRIRRLPVKRPLTTADIFKPAFRLEQHGRLEIYYAPMDWLRPTARIAIVGITPGQATALIAYQTAVAGLAAGHSPARLLNDVKAAAPFSGFRAQLVQWLEYLGVHRHLGLTSAQALWTDEGRRYFHSTSAVRYPVLADGKNYNGTSPTLAKHPLLTHYVDEVLGPELAAIPDALVVPLGVRVDEAIARLISAGALSASRCLVGFPHPSGSNGHKTKQWEANRAGLKRKVTRWFREHPLPGDQDATIAA
jgi:hypothetical protein